MPQIPISFTQGNFDMGVVSPEAQGNVDIPKYNYGLASCNNFLLPVTGGAFRRQGTKFIGTLDSLMTFDRPTGKYTRIYGPHMVRFHYTDTDVCLVLYEIQINHDRPSQEGNIYILNARCIDVEGNPMGEWGIKVDIFLLNAQGQMHQEVLGIRSVHTFEAGNVLYFTIVQESAYLQPFPNWIMLKMSWNPISRVFELNSGVTWNFVDDHWECEGNYQDFIFAPQSLPEVLIPLRTDTVNNDNITFSYNIAQAWNKVIFEDDCFRPLMGHHTLNPPNSYFSIQVRTDQDEVFYAMAMLDPTKWKQGAGTGRESFTVNRFLDTTWTGKIVAHKEYVNWSFNAFTSSRGGFAPVLGFFGNRLWYAKDTTLWASSMSPNNVTDFRIGHGVAAGFSAKLSYMEVSQIRWIFGSNRLFFGTDGGLFIAGDNTIVADAITPTNFKFTKLSRVACSSLHPVESQDGLILVDSTGSKVYELLPNESGIYALHDLSLLAKNLLKDGIISHEWIQFPLQTYYAVTSRGELRACFYNRKLGIISWVNNFLGGDNVAIQKIRALPSDSSDKLFLLTNRKVWDGEHGGWTDRYILEFLATDVMVDEADMIYLDCSKVFNDPYPAYFFSIAYHARLQGLDPDETLEHRYVAFHGASVPPPLRGMTGYLDSDDNPASFVLYRVFMDDAFGERHVICDFQGWQPDPQNIFFLRQIESSGILYLREDDILLLRIEVYDPELVDRIVAFVGNDDPQLDFRLSEQLYILHAPEAEDEAGNYRVLAFDPPPARSRPRPSLRLDPGDRLPTLILTNREHFPEYTSGKASTISKTQFTEIRPGEYYMNQFFNSFNRQMVDLVNDRYCALIQDATNPNLLLVYVQGEYYPFPMVGMNARNVTGIFNKLLSSVSAPWLAGSSEVFYTLDHVFKPNYVIMDYEGGEIPFEEVHPYLVTVGYNYPSNLSFLPLELAADSNTPYQSTVGKPKVQVEAHLDLLSSAGGQYSTGGRRYPILTQESNVFNTLNVFTGIVSFLTPGLASPTQTSLSLYQPWPLPFNIRNITRTINVA
jgi:hypothetical protein